ncbi:hypothetical protein [Luteolibacter sp.]|uniref:hypothetical protein n=1 Tax=Luteolibacter sp. TaxID=1962973 RepID=UPI003262F46B
MQRRRRNKYEPPLEIPLGSKAFFAGMSLIIGFSAAFLFGIGIRYGLGKIGDTMEIPNLRETSSQILWYAMAMVGLILSRGAYLLWVRFLSQRC